MNRCQTTLHAVLLAATTVACAHGQQADATSDRLEAHLQARVLADGLVASIFDIQLRHLEENGLSDRSAYAEIQASRERIAQLASVEMEELTGLLVKLQATGKESQSELVSQTRAAARRVAISMMAERQRLRGRLRSSRTMILVRQMIALETQALAKTDRMKLSEGADRGSLVEQVIQSHLDLDVLYEQLVLMLQRGKDSIGQERIIGVAAIKVLTEQQVQKRISSVGQRMKLDEFEAARREQQAIVETLQEVLRLLQQGDRLEEEARRKALESVAITAKEQRELQTLTESAELADTKQRDDLADRQRQISQALEQLRESLNQLAPVDELTSAATDAARSAADKLAKREKQEALQQQTTVLKLLEKLTDQLNPEPLDPEALADRAAQLEELSTALDDLIEKQSEAGELAADDPATAAELEAAIADALDEADDASELSNGVESQIDQAQDAVAKALETLEDGSLSSEQNRLEAVDNAENSLMEAAVEVQSQLADAKQAMEAANPSESNTPSDSTSKNEASSGTTRDSGSNALSEQATDVERRSFEKEAWFTSLPADLQNRIRAATRRPPPRGYEMKLRRYFQTSD